MKPMTDALRKKIVMHIREKMDIAELIDGVSIKGENLSNAVITKMVRVRDDITGADFTNAIIGTPNGPEINLSGCVVRNVVFKGTRVLTKFLFRSNDARGCNFVDAFVPYAEWQGSDLRNCKFCGIIMCLGSVQMRGALFDPTFFKDLGKAMNLSITVGKESKDASS